MDETLSSLFAKADALRRQVDEGTIDDIQSKVQECIALYERCKQLVEHLALFSSNETVDDIATSELKYLLIDYYLAELTEKRFTVIEERQSFLLQAKEYYDSFLKRLDDYLLLPPESKKANTPQDLRAAKIAEYKLQKSLTTKLSDLESRLDDEDLRTWSLTSIDLAALKTRQNLQSIASELDLLSSRPAPPIQPSPQQGTSQGDTAQETEEAYSERLDRLPPSAKSGPLLSGEGKILRPFVLTKRDALKQGVFRPDHSLPTMSIDEYLEEEIRRGGIQLPGQNAPSGEDRVKTLQEEEEEEDKETMKQREWDEYVEAHAKGSGNMGFNRG